MPKISIVLPVYNGERYIKESINSIISQTLTDWELIIVNDHSIDSTVQIIEEYCKEDPRIHIINNTYNMKLPKSLNKGFEYAKGKYLTWTSDDNIYLSNALADMYNFLENNQETPMVCANMEIIDTKGDVIGKHLVFNNNELAYVNSVGACFLYRREILEDIGKYDDSLFLVEDYDYWLRIQEKYGEISFINKTLYKYRRHERSLSIAKQKQVAKSLKTLREKHCNYIFHQLKNYPNLLYCIFAENIINKNHESQINKLICGQLPEVLPILENKNNRKVVIFGAGNYGREFCRQCNDEIVCFVDNNQGIVGQSIEGIEIKSLEEIVDYKEDYKIIIAMSIDKHYEVILQLWNKGFRNYSIWIKA